MHECRFDNKPNDEECDQSRPGYEMKAEAVAKSMHVLECCAGSIDRIDPDEKESGLAIECPYQDD